MPYHNPNPCDECLVKAACTEMCDAKNDYTDAIICKLTDISQHIYNKEGYKRKNVPPHFMRWYNRAADVCEKNSEECQRIMDRYVSYGIHKYL
ncbi:MAG: hypothetical protein R3267_04220 [Paenisporosarcina sp.]|nr:hypothetical protein [Paenisporosarcina sp.]